MKYSRDHYKHYQHYISEISYRLGFEVIREDMIDGEQDVIWKIEDGEKTELANSIDHARNELWFYAWRKLLDDYDLHDVFWAYGWKEPCEHNRQF